MTSSIKALTLIPLFFLFSCGYGDNGKLYRAGDKPYGGKPSYFFVNSKGKEVFPGLRFREIPGNECGEPRPVQNEQGLWGYVTRKGPLVDPKFTYASCFYGGLAKIKIGKKMGILREDGTWQVEPKREVDFGLPADGRILVYRTWENRSWTCPQSVAFGFADDRGDVVIPINFSIAKDFREGVAMVALPCKPGLGYINTSGNLTIPIEYGEALSSSEGLIGVRPLSSSKFGFIDHSNKIIIDFIYDDIKPFHDGVAAIKINGLWGYVNNHGKIAISPRYKEADSFYGGLARVLSEKGYFYINKEGEMTFSG